MGIRTNTNDIQRDLIDDIIITVFSEKEKLFLEMLYLDLVSFGRE